MQEKFADSLNVHIHTIDSEEAKGYTFKSSTNVLLDDEWVPTDVAIDNDKMENYLSQKL
jgi:hypothetical protein